jgi:excisionase family DNA binding protein
MTKERKLLPPPGYISSEEAAQILGVSTSRIYQYVDEERLPVYKLANAFMFLAEDIEQFRRNPTGRARNQPPSWRTYKGGGKVLATEIEVQVREGQQEQLTEKLQAIKRSGQHRFPGTIARYIMKKNAELTSVKILLIWKSTEMPDEEVRQQHLAAFQAELADVLDWETAEIETNEAIIHT